MVVTNIADPFVAGVVSGIEETADRHGLSVFLANSNAEPERELRVVRKFEERRVDGIIVTASRVGDQYVPLLTHMHVPVVLLNNQHPSQFAHSVMIANTEASRDATRHLIGLGHRRIAYLGDRQGYQSDTERYAGYRQALKEAGLRFEPRLVAQGDGKPEGAEEAAVSCWRCRNRPPPSSATTTCRRWAPCGRSATAACTIPADISVVGFDDLYISQYLNPPLTTVRQPMRQMGNLAMETLLQIFAGAGCRHDIKVPGELIVRESTARHQRRNDEQLAGPLRRCSGSDREFRLRIPVFRSSANWPRGEQYAAQTGGNELAIVVLGGVCSVTTPQGEWPHIGGRSDVFDGLPYTLYLPVGTRFLHHRRYRLRPGVLLLPRRRAHPARLVTPGRGARGNPRRRQRHAPDPPHADVRNFRRIGCWWWRSSRRPATGPAIRRTSTTCITRRAEVDLEEIYYYRIDRPEGYAMQKVYTEDRRIDETLTVRDGELVLIPEGYHPVVAAHGYNVYYLNALAGSARSMAASDDPGLRLGPRRVARAGPEAADGEMMSSPWTW